MGVAIENIKPEKIMLIVVLMGNVGTCGVKSWPKNSSVR